MFAFAFSQAVKRAKKNTHVALMRTPSLSDDVGNDPADPRNTSGTVSNLLHAAAFHSLFNRHSIQAQQRMFMFFHMH